MLVIVLTFKLTCIIDRGRGKRAANEKRSSPATKWADSHGHGWWAAFSFTTLKTDIGEKRLPKKASQES